MISDTSYVQDESPGSDVMYASRVAFPSRCMYKESALLIR